MDYALKSRKLNEVSEILDTVSEQPVSLDFTLPDYCPDIEKILKCSLDVKIYTRTLSAGQLRIDGASVVHILYCDSIKTALRCYEQTLPFSATFPVNADVGDHIILVSAKPEYLNCRALTPRRLTVSGAFSLRAAILCKNTYDLYGEDTNDSLQTKSETASVCELCEFSQDQFSLTEEISLRSKSTVESIIRSELSLVPTDCKHTGDKVMLKGDVTLRMLYICDASTGETDQFVYVFPFTQMIDAADSDCNISDVRIDVLSYELMLKSEPMSEEPVVSLDAKLCASLMGYKTMDVSFVSDAYSTCADTSLEFENTNLCTDVLPITATTMSKSTLSLGDRNIQKIVDIFSEDATVSADVKDSNLVFSGKVNICILAYTDEGELVSIERQVDLSHHEMLQNAFTDIRNVCADVTSISYRLGENNDMELRLELRLGAVLMNLKPIRQVSCVNSISDTEKPMGNCALTLYYAKEGEKVWDIAKRFSTSMESLCSENSLTEDILSAPTMLLVLNV